MEIMNRPYVRPWQAAERRSRQVLTPSGSPASRPEPTPGAARCPGAARRADSPTVSLSRRGTGRFRALAV
jgi:hypothetical protein